MCLRFVLAATLIMYAFATEKYLSVLEGIQGFSITCDSEEKLALVLQHEGHRDFDYIKITRLPYINVEVLVKGNQVSYFKQLLDSNKIKYTNFIEDLRKAITEEFKTQQNVQKENKQLDKIYQFNHFPRHETINKYLEQLSKAHLDITLLNIGFSYEKRKVYGVKFSTGEIGIKPSILIDAGIHAREWIAPTTALYAISELSKQANRYLYESVDWYIIPVLNPDGYEYTHTKNRLWRKTRSRSRGSWCKGVDGNRNYGFKWMAIGASNDSCSDTYAGKRAFSEIETRNLRNFVLSKNYTIKVYLTLHSHGQYILYPWGFTAEPTENAPYLKNIGQEASLELAFLYGTQYIIGNSYLVLYPAAGGSDDWVMAVGRAELSYTIELPGDPHFIINATRINPIGSETFEAFKVFARYAALPHKDVFCPKMNNSK